MITALQGAYRWLNARGPQVESRGVGITCGDRPRRGLIRARAARGDAPALGGCMDRVYAATGAGSATSRTLCEPVGFAVADRRLDFVR